MIFLRKSDLDFLLLFFVISLCKLQLAIDLLDLRHEPLLLSFQLLQVFLQRGKRLLVFVLLDFYSLFVCIDIERYLNDVGDREAIFCLFLEDVQLDPNEILLYLCLCWIKDHSNFVLDFTFYDSFPELGNKFADLRFELILG